MAYATVFVNLEVVVGRLKQVANGLVVDFHVRDAEQELAVAALTRGAVHLSPRQLGNRLLRCWHMRLVVRSGRSRRCRGWPGG